MPPRSPVPSAPAAQPQSRVERPAAHHPPLRLRNMKDTTGKSEQNGRRKPRGDAFEIGVIRVFSRPGPDAKDRQRRLLSLLVKYATEDGYFTPGGDAPADDRPADDTNEAEA